MFTTECDNISKAINGIWGTLKVPYDRPLGGNDHYIQIRGKKILSNLAHKIESFLNAFILFIHVSYAKESIEMFQKQKLIQNNFQADWMSLLSISISKPVRCLMPVEPGGNSSRLSVGMMVDFR